eukprot:245977-Chlamydomonas_euryale.AAC.1
MRVRDDEPLSSVKARIQVWEQRGAHPGVNSAAGCIQVWDQLGARVVAVTHREVWRNWRIA